MSAVDVVIAVYTGAGVLLAYVIYNNENTNMKNLGDTFWYHVVRVTIMAYAVMFGPAIVVTFSILYIIIAVAGAVLKLIYKPFTWEKPRGAK